MEDAACADEDNQIHDKSLILIVIPGLTSDSESAVSCHILLFSLPSVKFVNFSLLISCKTFEFI